MIKISTADPASTESAFTPRATGQAQPGAARLAASEPTRRITANTNRPSIATTPTSRSTISSGSTLAVAQSNGWVIRLINTASPAAPIGRSGAPRSRPIQLSDAQPSR